MTILELQNIGKSFSIAGEKLDIIQDACLEIKKGEIVGLVGPSGCGKTTLLQIAGLLDKHDSGSVIIDGINCDNLSDKESTKIRGQKIGFIYQFHHLLPEFSALENVMIPIRINNKDKKEAFDKSSHLLEIVGLKDRMHHRPSELSGGERQRVAIARALANDPALLLADEPTGNLDPKNADIVFDILINQVKNINLSTLIVTHNYNLTDRMDMVFSIHNGKLERK